MQLDHLAGDGERQPGSSVLAFDAAVDLVEGFENALLSVPGNSLSPIPDVDAEFITLPFSGDCYAPLVGEFDGITDEIVKDLLQSSFISAGEGQVART